MIASPPSVTISAGVSLRPMTTDDLPAAAQLSKALSWPHRQEDWEFLFGEGDGVVAVLPDGTVVGTTLWWAWGERWATIGLVIVASAWQGHGIGRLLMAYARKALPGRVLMLSATSAGQPLYERLGFVPVGIVEQHQGSGVSAAIVRLEADERMRPVVAQDIGEIAALDRKATGRERATLIEHLVQGARGVVIDTADGIKGYAFCRKFGWGWLIGPASAQNLQQARALVAHWIGTHGGEFLRIDIPGECGLSGWLDQMGLIRVDTVNFMTTDGVVPEVAGEMRYFALTAQAIG